MVSLFGLRPTVADAAGAQLRISDMGPDGDSAYDAIWDGFHTGRAL